MAKFRITALKDEKARRMATKYLKCIALGSWTVKKNRKEVFKISVSGKNENGLRVYSRKFLAILHQLHFLMHD